MPVADQERDVDAEVVGSGPTCGKGPGGDEGGLGQAHHASDAGEDHEGQEDDGDSQTRGEDGTGRKDAGLHGEDQEGDEGNHPRKQSTPLWQAVPVIRTRPLLGGRTSLASSVTPDKEEEHHGEDERDRRGEARELNEERRDEVVPIPGHQILEHADQESRDQGDRNGTKTGEGEGRKRTEHNQREYVGVELKERGDEDAGETGHNHGQHPREGRRAFRVETTEAAQLLFVHRGADLEPRPSVTEHHPQSGGYDSGSNEDSDLIGVDVDLGKVDEPEMPNRWRRGAETGHRGAVRNLAGRLGKTHVEDAVTDGLNGP